MFYKGEDKEIRLIIRDKNKNPIPLTSCPQIRAVLYFTAAKPFQKYALNVDSNFPNPIITTSNVGELIIRVKRDSPVLSNSFGQLFLEIEIDFPNTNYPSNIFKTKEGQIPVMELTNSVIS
jgi:hypothetical protein